MPMATSPFVLRDVSLTLILADDAVGTAQEYRCQLTQAELVPTAGTGGGNELQTFCDTFTEPTGLASWALTISGFQDWSDATGLSYWLFEHEGEVAEFTLTPMAGPISATSPAFTGEVNLAPTNVGGTAGQYATFSGITLPCVQKPTIITTPPVVTGVTGGPEQPEPTEREQFAESAA